MFNFKHMIAIFKITTQQKNNIEKQSLFALGIFIQGLKSPTKFSPMKKFLRNPAGLELNPFIIRS